MELVGLESRRVEPSRAVFLLQGAKPLGNIRYADCAIMVPVASEKEAWTSHKHVESESSSMRGLRVSSLWGKWRREHVTEEQQGR
jgi:hypothetical protein